MQLMLQSPAFAAERDDTRDQTLHAIERLAQQAAARASARWRETLLELMHRARTTLAPARTTRRASPPTGWAAPGAAGLLPRARPARVAWLAATGPAAPARPARLPRRDRCWPPAAIVAWLLLRHSAALAPGHRRRGSALLAALLMLFPASEAVVAVINRLISESARPQSPAAAGVRRRHHRPSTGRWS